MKIILKFKYWIIAAILLITVLIVYQHFDFSRSDYVLIFCFLFLFGLILGLIPYKRMTYLRKINFTIPLSILFVSVSGLIVELDHEYGIFNEYNYFTAKRDIARNNIRLISYGLVDYDYMIIEERILKKYDISVTNQGCVIYDKGCEHYNNVMNQYIERKYGKDFWTKIDKSVVVIQQKSAEIVKNNKLELDNNKKNIIDSLINRYYPTK